MEVLNVRIVVLRVPRGEEKDKSPITQGEVVSELHMDTHRSLGPDGMQPRPQREQAEVLTEPPSIIYQHS